MTDPAEVVDPTRSTTLHLVIAGAMGVGKTTVGAIVAERLGWPFVDSDRVIERLYRRTGSDIAGSVGVARLHRIEAEVLADALDFAPPSVIAAAASVVDDDALLDRMAAPSVLVVLLTCESATLRTRAQAGRHRRHIEPDEADRLVARRSASLEPIAAAVVDVTALAPAAAAERIVSLTPS